MPMRPVEIGCTKTRGKRRYGWIDLARAVAMVPVVFGQRGLKASGLMRDVETASLDRVIQSFHVPPFFLVSEAPSARSINRNRSPLSWQRRIAWLLPGFTMRRAQICVGRS